MADIYFSDKKLVNQMTSIHDLVDGSVFVMNKRLFIKHNSQIYLIYNLRNDEEIISTHHIRIKDIELVSQSDILGLYHFNVLKGSIETELKIINSESCSAFDVGIVTDCIIGLLSSYKQNNIGKVILHTLFNELKHVSDKLYTWMELTIDAKTPDVCAAINFSETNHQYNKNDYCKFVMDLFKASTNMFVYEYYRISRN